MDAGKDDPDVGAGDQGVRLGFNVWWDWQGPWRGILKLGEMATTISSIVATEYKDFGFTLCSVGSQDKFHPVWHHHFQDTNGLIFVVDSVDRDRVEEANSELNKMMNEDEMRDAIVPACVNTLTSSTATRLGKLMHLLPLPHFMHRYLACWVVQGGDSAVAIHHLMGPPLTVHQTVVGENGLEVWRRFMRGFNPMMPMRGLQIMRKAMMPPKIGKQQDVRAIVNKWDGLVHVLERDYKMKIGILIHLMPDELKNSILQHGDMIK